MKTIEVNVLSLKEMNQYQCECGNSVCLDGYHPCDANGKQLSPFDARWNGLYACNTCGNIVLVEITSAEIDEATGDSSDWIDTAKVSHINKVGGKNG